MLLVKLLLVAVGGYAVWKVLPWFGAKQRRMVAKQIHIYFNTNVYPADELPPYIKEQDSNLWPAEKMDKIPALAEHEEEELSSDYYLRTRQRVSLDYPGWYGVEAWIRDIVAGKTDPEQLCNPFGDTEKGRQKNE